MPLPCLCHIWTLYAQVSSLVRTFNATSLLVYLFLHVLLVSNDLEDTSVFSNSLIAGLAEEVFDVLCTVISTAPKLLKGSSLLQPKLACIGVDRPFVSLMDAFLISFGVSVDVAEVGVRVVVVMLPPIQWNCPILLFTFSP